MTGNTKMYVATSREMQNIDRSARDEYGIPTLLLMENAAVGITRAAADILGLLKGKKITIVCGKGNNGGDGLAAARQMLNQGVRVQVYLLCDLTAVKGDAEINLNIARKIGADIRSSGMYDMNELRISLTHSDMIIDAMIGTGLSSPVQGDYAEVIGLINNSGRPVLAVDIPTGINADTGEVMGIAVKAQMTVTFALPKRGHLLYPGSEYTGSLHTADISIPAKAIDKESIYLHLLTEPDVRGLLPQRQPAAHKGSFGHVLVIAGSIGKGGAAAMTSLSCLRSGAGLITVAAPASVQPVIAEMVTEGMTCPLAETPEKTLALSAAETILELCRDKEVVAIGPGLTTHKETSAVVRKLLKEIGAPLVIDADGINAIAGHTDILRERKFPTILTPHPGEMGRLTGKIPSDVQKDRIGIARGFAMDHGVFLVLKGAHTIIAGPSGETYISPTGNPGMATAGTGDALTGILAGLIAQGMEISAAVRLGVYLHGLAGDMAARDVGTIGMLASDLITRIPSAIRYLQNTETSLS